MRSLDENHGAPDEENAEFLAVPKSSPQPRTARRSVERLLEERALRNQLQDELGIDGATRDLDDLD